MNDRQMQFLLEIAASGSLSAAAIVLGVEQPSLSRQLKLLEDEIGTRLFHRTGRGVQPTEAGTHLIAIAQRYLDDTARLRRSIERAGEPLRGRVTVGMVQFLGETFAPDLLVNFHAKYPEVSIHVVGGNSSTIQELLVAGRIDLGLVYNAGRTSDLLAEPILTEKLCLYGHRSLAAQHGLLGQRTIDCQDLENLPLIAPNRNHGLRKEIEQALRPMKCNLSVVFEVDNISTTKALVRSAAGFTILPFGACARDLSCADNYLIEIRNPTIDSVFSMVFARNRPMETPTGEFARMVRQEIRRFASESQLLRDRLLGSEAERFESHKLPSDSRANHPYGEANAGLASC